MKRVNIMVAVIVVVFAGLVLGEAVQAPKHKTLAGFYPVMMCDNCETFRVENGILRISGYGHLWTRDLTYDLNRDGKVTVETKARLHRKPVKDHSAELIIAFSNNLLGSNDGQSDALTFRIGCDEREANFFSVLRSRMYQNFIKTKNYYLKSDEWERLKVVLTEKELAAYAGGKEVLRADISGVDFPKQGHIGLLSVRQGLTEINWLSID